MTRGRGRNWALLALLVCGTLTVLACNREKPEPAEETEVAVEVKRLDVTNVALGRTIGADKKVVEEVGSFAPTDTIYASVDTEGSGSGTLAARWTFEDGQVVNESAEAIGGGAQVTEFHVSKPDGWPTGHYEVVILLDGREAARKGFDVEAGG